MTTLTKIKFHLKQVKHHIHHTGPNICTCSHKWCCLFSHKCCNFCYVLVICQREEGRVFWGSFSYDFLDKINLKCGHVFAFFSVCMGWKKKQHQNPVYIYIHVCEWCIIIVAMSLCVLIDLFPPSFCCKPSVRGVWDEREHFQLTLRYMSQFCFLLLSSSIG